MMRHNSLLWELSKGDNSARSYLFGTMHVKDEKAYQHIKKAQNALCKCSHFYSEINLDKAKLQLDTSHYLLADEASLDKALGQKRFDKMKTIFDRTFSFDLERHKRFLPLIILNMLAESVLREDNHQALDAYLWTAAKKLKLVCDGLETIEEQVSVLTALDLDVQLKMLKEVAENISKYRKSVISLSELYVNEDIVKLYQKTKRSLGALRKDLLYKRNDIMSNRIYFNIQQASFYAVGAAHLGGDKGILAKLKRKGITLKPI